MPDQDNTNTTPTTPSTASVDTSASDQPTPIIDSDSGSSPASVAPLMSEPQVANIPENHTDNSSFINDIATKISQAHNILVALSSDPSVDEISAAIGLAMYLDRLDKRVTAIYSGTTPNALKFLKPEETLEKTADILQDFVIALNKEKADHLRYKLDGNYVKIFITPYRSKITSDDLEFSYGDFNIDLVLALDVANGIDLDDALREHGRIMHDATVVNITTGKPGKLGEIEWSDKTASSVSEMVVELILGMGSQNPAKAEATAFLTGIVAATNRFASASTTSKTMNIASRLMEFGANQQLISKNITPDTENEMIDFSNITEKTDQDASKLDIQHDNKKDIDETKEVDTPVTEKESTLLAELQSAEDSLAQVATEVTAEDAQKPVVISTGDDTSVPKLTPEPTAESTVEPIAKPATEAAPEEANKYGQMLEEALKETAPNDSLASTLINSPTEETTITNPALASAPSVPTTPEINGVPSINYALPAEENILPPPPAPPVDVIGNDNFAPLGPQPAMQDQIYTPQAASPGSFQIPGM